MICLNSIFILILVLTRFGVPVDESRLEVRKWKDGVQMSAVGMDFEEPEAAMILKTEDDPATVRRIGTDERVDIAALVICYEA